MRSADAGAEQAQHPARAGRCAIDGRAVRRWPAVPRPHRGEQAEAGQQRTARRRRAASRASRSASRPRRPAARRPRGSATGRSSPSPARGRAGCRARGRRPRRRPRRYRRRRSRRPSAAQTATQRKEPASACAHQRDGQREQRPTASTGRRPTRSDSQPARAEVMPQAVAVSDTRLATSGMLTSRSRAMSSRKGARVVPLEVAAKEPRQAAPIRAQGKASGAFFTSAAADPNERSPRPINPRPMAGPSLARHWRQAAPASGSADLLTDGAGPVVISPRRLSHEARRSSQLEIGSRASEG